MMSQLHKQSKLEQLGQFEQMLKEKVIVAWGKFTLEINIILAKGEYDRFLNCLVKIGIHYPAFLREFHLKLLSIVPKIVGELKIMALQIILWSVDLIDNLFQQLQPELRKLLTHR